MRRARQPGEVGFKQTADGRHLFFPYGVFSKGRLIDSEATYQRLLSHQKRWFLFGVITAIVMARLPAEGFVICLGLFAAVHYLFTNRITSKLHVVDERPTLDDLRDGLSGFFAGTFTTVLLFILGALFTLGGVLLLFLSKDGMAGPLGVTGLGVGLIVLSWMGGGNARDGAP